MRRKLFYNVNHFITFFPETVDWQHSRIRIVVDKFSIFDNTNIKTSKKASLFASHGIVRTNSVD